MVEKLKLHMIAPSEVLEKLKALHLMKIKERDEANLSLVNIWLIIVV